MHEIVSLPVKHFTSQNIVKTVTWKPRIKAISKRFRRIMKRWIMVNTLSHPSQRGLTKYKGVVRIVYEIEIWKITENSSVVLCIDQLFINYEWWQQYLRTIDGWIDFFHWRSNNGCFLATITPGNQCLTISS